MYTVKQIKNKLLLNIDESLTNERALLKERLSYLNIINNAVKNKQKLHFYNKIIVLDQTFINSFFNEKEIKLLSTLKNTKFKETLDSKVPTEKDKIIFLSSTPKKNKPQKKEQSVDFEQMIKPIDKCLSGVKKFLIFDVEAYEKNNKIMLELGILEGKGKSYSVEHYIIEENKDIFNGKYVPDNKFNFNFGKSTIIKLDEAIAILSEKLSNTDFVIGHNISHDFKFLSKMGFNVNQTNRIDTASLSKFLDRLDGKKLQSRSIKRCLEYFDKEHNNLHNAGNDCVYNYFILKKLNSLIKNNLKKKNSIKKRP